MAIFKCKMCGSELQVLPSQSVAECEYCGSKQTLPKLEGNDRKANLFDRANHFFREGEFDKAMDQYEKILSETPDDCDIYWSLVLCRFGVRYVEDPKTKKRIPTVNRVQYTSIFDDENYKSALKYANGDQRTIYEDDARTINEIQKGILAISQNEEPFDVFICYKETDDKEPDPKRKRTHDSVLAHELYFQLTQEDFKVFFAPITLEDKLGQEYEPYIFAALQSAKVMVVLGTKPEYFNAPWVKNEWSRYLTLIRAGAQKVLIPAYRDMDPYDMPEEFSHLQAQDMSKLGFMQDLIRGIKKIVGVGSIKSARQETVISSADPDIAPKLKRVFLLLEDGEFSHADELCEEVLNKDPENAQAYLAKLMIELQVKKKSGLALLSDPFTSSNHYSKILRFGDAELRKELDDCNRSIIERAEERRIRGIYTESVRRLQSATEASVIEEIRESLIPIRQYKDANAYVQLCDEKLDFLAKAPTYVAACTVLNDSNIWQGRHKDLSSYEEAITMLRSLNGWRDSEEKIRQCQEHIDQIHLKEEYARMEVIYQEAKHAMNHIGTPVALEKAIEKFESIQSYMDSTALAEECRRKIEYQQKNPAYVRACEIFDESKVWEGSPKNVKAYERAIHIFKSLNGFLDSEQKIEQCQKEIVRIHEEQERARQLAEQRKAERELRKEQMRQVTDRVAKKSIKAAVIVVPVVALVIFVTLLFTLFIPNSKYNKAVALMNEEKYEEAIAAFEKMDGYKDSLAQIDLCRDAILARNYAAALELISQQKYEEAIAAFEALGNYKDSAEKISQCRLAILDRKYAAALNLMQNGKYQEAIEAFQKLDGHKDSPNKIAECYAALDLAYDAALALMNEGKYDEAITALQALNGYRNSKKKIELAQLIKNLSLKSEWTFGAYEQDGNDQNGKEEIEWIILDKNGTQLLLISKYALDNITFHTSQASITWETSDIRAWLNTTLLNNAFSAEQQAIIVKSLVSADPHPNYETTPGKDTADRLFLLSILQVQQYLTSNSERLCTPTAYAISQGATPTCRWWLRTPTYSNSMSGCVDGDGSVKMLGDLNTTANTVRPAMWIDLNLLSQYN